MRKIYILFFTTIFFLNVFGNAPSLQFKHITPDEGISSSTVTSFLQDHKGFMWIGTYYGLNRFDGIDFTIYQNQLADYNSLPHNLVFCIYEDQNRELWIGTARGLSKFDWGNDNFLNCMSDSNSALNGTECNVLSIAQDSLNRFYLGTDIGLILYDPEKNIYKQFVQKIQNPNDLGINYIENVFIDSRNTIWIGTSNGLEIFDPENETFEQIFNQSALSDASVVSITEDRKRNIWLATSNGLYCLRHEGPQKYSIKQYQHNPNDKFSISANNIISSLFKIQNTRMLHIICLKPFFSHRIKINTLDIRYYRLKLISLIM